MSTSQTRSNWRAIVFVRCSIRRRSVRASRSSLNQRSAQRAWSSRSGQPWQGWARSRWRSSSMPRVSGVDPTLAAPSSLDPDGGGGVRSCVRLRRVEARSRRDWGLRPLKLRGTFSRVIDPDRGREVDEAQPPRVPVGGEDVGTRSLAVGAARGWSDPRVDHHRHPREPAAGHLDHVAGAQRLQRVDHLLATVGPARLGEVLLGLAESRCRSPAYSMKSPRSQLAASAYPVERLLGLAQLPGEPDDGLVGLELGERGLEQLAGALAAVAGAPG